MDENVKKALKELDAAHNQRFAPWRSQWQTIRARLVELEAQLFDYENASKHAADDCMAKDAEIARLQSRLAAADALLRDIKAWDVTRALQPTREETLFAIPHELRVRITVHLSENGND